MKRRLDLVKKGELADSAIAFRKERKLLRYGLLSIEDDEEDTEEIPDIEPFEDDVPDEEPDGFTEQEYADDCVVAQLSGRFH